MLTLFSSFVDNLSDRLYCDNCADCKSCLEYVSIIENQLIIKCFTCNKNYEKEFNEDSIKRYVNIYEFCNKDINKFILLLREGIYLYEYMDSWERFDETLNKENK